VEVNAVDDPMKISHRKRLRKLSSKRSLHESVAVAALSPRVVVLRDQSDVG